MNATSLNDILGSTHIDSRDLLDLRKTLDIEDEEERSEVEQIDAIVTELEEYAGDNAADGIFLVRESYWEEYAEELAEDIGATDRAATWPNNCIDWERAARELAGDYTTIDIDGISYYYR